MTDIDLPAVADAAGSSSTDPIAWLVNYGVAGVVLALLVLGRLRTKAEVDGLREQLAKAQSDLRERDVAMQALIAQVTQHTLPQMSHLAEVLDRVPVAQSIQPGKTIQDQLADILARLDSQRQEGA